ncbi:uncharacterized protein MELLADRAFT_91067 [Melampsora larici-populina 98AG31]|uniref:Uncharacterized protein n=1 Tax=Melampsora larici-populina (strain 98AG31 / pathotype 3-4-7) TaxID=747676 RepID=F4R8J9_MELLP|nr:uncharacterized protein MELLADRAFT_91067 [Melampsora larici-populina 98AG31]EGG11493.1 hypothetical protein MELLADRAFT_91067 [Melampsora larici-populina 98AG31]
MALSLAVGTYEKLTLRWFGEFDVVALRQCGGPLRREYDGLVNLCRAPGVLVPVLLVDESRVESPNLAGPCRLSGVVVQGGDLHFARLILDEAAWVRDTNFPAVEGLTVSGRRLVLRDTTVCTDSCADEWRVASLVHKEWDTAHLMFRQFEVDYIYDGKALSREEGESMRVGEVITLAGEVVNMSGRGGKWIVKVVTVGDSVRCKKDEKIRKQNQPGGPCALGSLAKPDRQSSANFSSPTATDYQGFAYRPIQTSRLPNPSPQHPSPSILKPLITILSLPASSTIFSQGGLDEYCSSWLRTFPIHLTGHRLEPQLSPSPLRMPFRESFRSDYSKAFTFKPTLDPFHSDYSRSIMQNFSQAQINLDDTPIGQRPYPSTRRALAAAAVDHVSETTASIGDRSSSLPLADVIFGPPVARDPSPAASSDIEIVSSNLPPRVPLSDKKPGMHSFCFRPLGSHILTFKTFVCGLVLQPSGARVTTPQPLSVAYTMCLLKGTDITKGPAKKNAKPVYSTIPIPATKKPFDLNETSLARLKQRLFDLASEIDNDQSKGNTAILQTADAMKQVKIYAFITAHDTWAKNQERTITEDIHVSSFFQSVLGALGKHAGFVIVMDNPARCAQEAIDANFARFFLVQELTKNQARLRAQNTLNNVVTTASDLAHATPVDPHSRWLTALQDHHGSLKNNKAEGWRIFNPKDLTLKMELTFHHLILWAREL